MKKSCYIKKYEKTDENETVHVEISHNNGETTLKEVVIFKRDLRTFKWSFDFSIDSDGLQLRSFNEAFFKISDFICSLSESIKKYEQDDVLYSFIEYM